MTRLLLLALVLMTGFSQASTITIVPIYEPLSLHGTDSDEINDIGEALRAAIMPRPMALSGAFPEVLVDSIATPHQAPTNTPNYKPTEINLLVLCGIGIAAEMGDESLRVTLNVAELAVPQEVDLTTRQVLKLAILAVRRTLEAYQLQQDEELMVSVVIVGTTDSNDSLRDLAQIMTLGE